MWVRVQVTVHASECEGSVRSSLEGDRVASLSTVEENRVVGGKRGVHRVYK